MGRTVVGVPLTKTVSVTRLISAFRCHFPSDFRSPGEQRAGWEFVYVESGRVKARADDRDYLLKAGELACHKPDELHTIRSYHGESDVIVFCFQSDSPRMSFFNNRIFPVSPREKQYLSDVAALAERFFYPKDPSAIARDGDMKPDPSAEPAIGQRLQGTIELLILSLLSAEGTERRLRMDSYDLHRQRKTLTSDIKAYLDAHLSEKILLSDVSRHVSYSPSSIKRIFREETGESIMRYLMRQRIGHAKELLLAGASVTDAAQDAGFETVNYFSTVFKAETGQTPSAFRAGR